MSTNMSKCCIQAIEQHELDTNAGKQLPHATTGVYLILVLKK